MTLDLGLPPDADGVEEGFLSLAEMLEQDILAKVIVITGRQEKEHALRAVAQGAYDFFCKPIQIEELKFVLQRALYLYRLEHEHRVLQQRLSSDSFEGMVGTSPQMQQVFATIRKVAASEVPVLIEGESGTGKELTARALHNLGSRKTAPFVAINCGAIPENLLESELFGHEKGAFTGAHAQKKGRIESAQGGTLFLDEIGELSLPLQVKLLRFLQEHRIIRVGGTQEIEMDARLITATNSDLKQAMKTGTFREDLYFRLGVVRIQLPPLREREGDILFLAKALLQKHAAESGKKIAGFTAQTERLLQTHHWPGNVRELENRIRRAVVMAEGAKLSPTDLALDSEFSKYSGLGLREAREALEYDMIQRVLIRHKGNISQAAAELEISRPTLYELIEKVGIKRS